MVLGRSPEALYGMVTPGCRHGCAHSEEEVKVLSVFSGQAMQEHNSTTNTWRCTIGITHVDEGGQIRHDLRVSTDSQHHNSSSHENHELLHCEERPRPSPPNLRQGTSCYIQPDAFTMGSTRMLSFGYAHRTLNGNTMQCRQVTTGAHPLS